MRAGALLAVAALLATTCVVHAARALDRNSALIGWSEEASSQRIVLSTSYGEVRFSLHVAAVRRVVMGITEASGGIVQHCGTACLRQYAQHPGG